MNNILLLYFYISKTTRRKINCLFYQFLHIKFEKNEFDKKK